MPDCIRCGKATCNPKYCSRNCAATHLNKLHARRRPTNFCVGCGKGIRKRCRHCGKCRAAGFFYPGKTLADITGRAKYQIHGEIRDNARRVYRKSGRPRSCLVCGYSKHVDICHRRGIATFSPTTLVVDINHLDNLVALCKNHHWEFDHGLLEVAI